MTVAVSGLLAAWLQGWFGVSDLTALVIWSAPLCLITASLAACVVRRFARWAWIWRYLIGVGVGLTLGFLWTCCVAWAVGPWWGTMSLPALACWMVGGAAGFAGGLALGPGAPAHLRIAGAVGLLALAGSGVVGYRPLVVRLSHDQTLSVRFLKWTPGEGSLTIESRSRTPLADAEVAALRRAGLTGRVVVLWADSQHGRGPAATAMFVMKHPIAGPIRVRQPDRSIAVYVQSADGFDTYPPDLRTLDREIELSPQARGVWCSVQGAHGGIQRGPVRIW